MSSDVAAIVVRQREQADCPAVDVRWPDARYAAVDSLGHLHLYAEEIGSPRRILGVVAAGVWLSWKVDTPAPCPGTCPPLASVTRLPLPSVASVS